MFNSSLKKQALSIHEEVLKKYNASYDKMQKACEELYSERQNSVKFIKMAEMVINSIANTPKEFDKKMGDIHRELDNFQKTEEYAKEAYEAEVKAGANIAGGAAAGLGVAAMAPTALMSIATTFGTAATGTAIRTLSGAAAQKAAVAWLGRTFAGFAVKEGAGMAVGEAFLALAGPIGWGITAASTGISLISLSNKNKELANVAVKEAKEIARASESLDEMTEKVHLVKEKTVKLLEDMDREKDNLMSLTNKNYMEMDENTKLFLGKTVNNIYALSALLNETVK